jgi:hypothetical protein
MYRQPKCSLEQGFKKSTLSYSNNGSLHHRTKGATATLSLLSQVLIYLSLCDCYTFDDFWLPNLQDSVFSTVASDHESHHRRLSGLLQ